MASKSSKSTKTAKPALAAVPSEAAAPVAEAAPAPAPKIAIVPKKSDTPKEAAPKADALKMKELLTAVVNKTGAKKKEAKDVVDAVLAEIAATLAAGKSLSLPPLGNLRVAKTQEKGGAKMMVLKLRMGGSGGDKDPLADDE